MRGMYSNLRLRDSEGRELKPYHHIWLNAQFISDCKIWQRFLEQTPIHCCRPFIDFQHNSSTSIRLDLYSDASKSAKRGMGAIFLEENKWLIAQWPRDFIIDENPSIEFLELFALAITILTWGKSNMLTNRRVTVFCDNESVMYMVNSLASSCMQSQKLLRLLALDNLMANRRLTVQHIVYF